jgi:CRP/FNR family cyclic AMP-dependent transcriptional regulator
MFGKRSKSDGAAARLRGLAFFEGFTEAELDRVAELAEDVTAEAGALLIDQGRMGTECFVIEVGYAGVYVGDEHVVTLGPGSMVGEMALIERMPRSASVVAETPVRLLAFDNRSFMELLSEMPKAEERVKTLLASRLKANAPTD